MPFYDFMQKLVLARQIKFNKGKIELLNQKLSIFPISVFSTIIENNPSTIPDVYKSTKNSAELFASETQKLHKFTGRELANWLIDIIAFSGWGIAKFTIYNGKDLSAKIRFDHSTIGEIASKKEAVDHAVRGFFAGGGSISMNKNIECLEIKCIAKGDKICEFVLGETKTLKKEYPELFKTQLGWINGKGK